MSPHEFSLSLHVQNRQADLLNEANARRELRAARAGHSSTPWWASLRAALVRRVRMNRQARSHPAAS